MPKIYLNKNVLDAANERLEWAFTNFDHLCLSFSGGKDSSVMVQLAHSIAQKLNKKFSLLFIDLEAQYQATITHIEEVYKKIKTSIETFYWLCIPIQLRNAVSALQPEWCCWDPSEKWVRPLPDNPFVVTSNSWIDGHTPFESFDDVVVLFAKWLAEKIGGTIGCGIGIRSNESFNRFRTIVSETKTRFKNKPWTTQIINQEEAIPAFNFYPIYDWHTSDIWGAVSKLNLLYNPIYELMWKSGLSIHKARLCQPFGDDQRSGLDLFKQIEPDTWERLLTRVNGVNFGNIYCRTSLLGHLKSEKPKHFTWQQYAVFLLESLGLQAPEVRNYVYSRIDYFLRWYETHAGLERNKMADSKKDGDPSWERIAKALEKNDFWLQSLSFTSTKEGMKILKSVKEKYNIQLFGDGEINAEMRRTKTVLEP